MPLIDIIVKEVEQFNKDLARILQVRNLVDTRRALKSLRVVKSSRAVLSVGVDYLEFLDRGSGPWADKSQKSKLKLGFILKVSGWAARKGVNPWAAASVIVESGSQIFRGEKAGIEINNLISDFTKRLVVSVTAFSSLQITRGLNKFNSVRL